MSSRKTENKESTPPYRVGRVLAATAQTSIFAHNFGACARYNGQHSGKVRRVSPSVAQQVGGMNVAALPRILVVDADAGPFAVVLTDYEMPQLDGPLFSRQSVMPYRNAPG